MTRSFKPTRERKQRRKPKHHGLETEGNKALDVAPITTTSTITINTLVKDATGGENPNAEIIIPRTKAEKDELKRAQLQAEFRAGAPKMSSRKKKRLDKYIEKKMRKQEAIELLDKLSHTKIDTWLLRSAKTLGSVKESKKERVRRAFMEQQAGINVEGNIKVVYEERAVPNPDDFEEAVGESMRGLTGEATQSEYTEELDKTRTRTKARQSRGADDVEEKTEQNSEFDPEEARKVLEEIHHISKHLLPTAVGTGLKRPLETDESGRPIIKKIKRASKIDAIPKFEFHNFEAEVSLGEDKSVSEAEQYSDEDVAGSQPEEEGSEEESEDASGNEDGEKVEKREEDSEEAEDSEEEEDSEEGEDSEDTIAPVGRLKRGKSERASAFKQWALQQRKLIDGEVTQSIEEGTSMPVMPTIPQNYIHKTPARDASPSTEPTGPSVERKAFYVTVDRPIEIQTSRLALPVVAEEQKIMEAIHNNPCVVVCGETGSGKTTQVPQFLFEAGYGNPESDTPGLIGVTQPRRVAAVSMAKRVGDELGVAGKDKVSYQIRFEATVNPRTVIKFMTDGVLLRELSVDFLLRKYSVIIIDEAHERGINTDILIGVMSRVIKLREQMHKEDKLIKPLKLVIMSATLRVSDFTENKALFATPPPVLKAEARQYPVSMHFSRRTPVDYVEGSYHKICRIHRKLPSGAILVFLTGQQEIQDVLRRLRREFPSVANQYGSSEIDAPVKVSAKEAPVETEEIDLGGSKSLLSYDTDGDDIDTDGDMEEDMGEEQSAADSDAPLHVLPLYSLLPTKEQLRIFDPPPTGTRLCVLATNVAETSLTIPGIRYVVDCGRVKERNFDKATGVQSYDITWVSKASAMQRAGRAGRTGPGHCYRMYSSAVYERDFEEFAEAEILKMPIEGVVLQMKSMNIDTIVNFPFPTPPDRASLQKAEKLLSYLSAIDQRGNLTELGRIMSVFPLPPRFAKILIIGQQHGCLPYVIAIVAALSVGEIYIPVNQLDLTDDSDDSEEDRASNGNNGHYKNNEKDLEKARRQARRKAYYKVQAIFSSLDPKSDVLKLLCAVCAFEYEHSGNRKVNKGGRKTSSVTNQQEELFCSDNFLRLKGMQETRKLREQLTALVKLYFPTAEGIAGSFTAKLPPPTPIQVKAIKQIISAGFIDQVALRSDLVPNSTIKLHQSRKITDVPYTPLFPVSISSAGFSVDTADPSGHVFIHPASLLTALPTSSAPQYMIYSELKRTSTNRIRFTPLTTITPAQLSSLARKTSLLTYSKPLEHIPPKIIPESQGERRESWVIPRLGGGIGKSGVGWPLQAVKVIQRKQQGGRWEIE